MALYTLPLKRSSYATVGKRGHCKDWRTRWCERCGWVGQRKPPCASLRPSLSRTHVQQARDTLISQSPAAAAAHLPRRPGVPENTETLQPVTNELSLCVWNDHTAHHAVAHCTVLTPDPFSVSLFSLHLYSLLRWPDRIIILGGVGLVICFIYLYTYVFLFLFSSSSPLHHHLLAVQGA